MNNRGFAMIESLIALTFAVAFLSGGLSLAYFALSRSWLNRAAYETSICLSTSLPASQCEAELRRQARQSLPIGNISYVSLKRARSFVETKVTWRLGVSGAFQDLEIHDRRTLPLLGASR